MRQSERERIAIHISTCIALSVIANGCELGYFENLFVNVWHSSSSAAEAIRHGNEAAIAVVMNYGIEAIAAAILSGAAGYWAAVTKHHLWRRCLYAIICCIIIGFPIAINYMLFR